jgi:hypothetical protein
MENKIKEAIISRRSFFKSAASKALPMLGIVALVSKLTSCIEIDEPEKVGTRICSGCSATCQGGCEGGSGGSCGANCSGKCSKSCSGSCIGNCSGSCGTGCAGQCTNACTSRCKFVAYSG